MRAARCGMQQSPAAGPRTSTSASCSAPSSKGTRLSRARTDCCCCCCCASAGGQEKREGRAVKGALVHAAGGLPMQESR
jgi:hypothetical protein